MRTNPRRVLAVAVAGVGLAVLVGCGPLRMGGPNNVLGNDPVAGGVQPGYWAAINGPFSNHADGDPYNTRCARNAASATTCDLSGVNGTYDPKGERFGIDVRSENLNAPVSVALYDPAMGPNPALDEGQTSGPFSTSFELFAPSDPPGSNRTDPALSMASLGSCTDATTGSHVFAPGVSGPYANLWFTLCTFTPTAPGTYVLQVKSSAIPGVVDQGGGWNAFSIRATATSGSQPPVYPLITSSIWMPQPGSSPQIYLGNFDQTSAGRTLMVDLFDPGDGNAGSTPFTVQVLAPPSGAPALVPTGGTPVSCAFNAVGSSAFGPATPNTADTCTVTTAMSGTPGFYNDRWLRLSIPIPASYSCAADCWWTLAYHFGNASSPTDRVTWRVSLQ
jgi:hypothetical protein